MNKGKHMKHVGVVAYLEHKGVRTRSVISSFSLTQHCKNGSKSTAGKDYERQRRSQRLTDDVPSGHRIYEILRTIARKT
jgi:hypothetical protein